MNNSQVENGYGINQVENFYSRNDDQNGDSISNLSQSFKSDLSFGNSDPLQAPKMSELYAIVIYQQSLL